MLTGNLFPILNIAHWAVRDANCRANRRDRESREDR